MRDVPPGMVTVSEAMRLVGVGRTQVINLLNSGKLVGTSGEGPGTPRFVDRSSAEAYALARSSARRKRDPQAIGSLARRLDDLTLDVEHVSESLGVNLERAESAGGPPAPVGNAARAVARLQTVIARRDAQIAKLKEVAKEENEWREAVDALLRRGEQIRQLYRDAYQG